MKGVGLLFASGFTALTYEVLWVRQLGLVFGSSASSAATCLAVFFLGMSIGQLIAARRCATLGRPLTAYGVLELLAAATTLGALALPYFYTAFYREFFDAMTSSWLFAGGVRLLLSTCTLLPPAVLLGATLPVMVEAETRATGTFARHATALYAANTLGGVLGALSCSFLLAPKLGFLLTYLLVAAVNVAIGVVAIALDGASAVEGERAGATDDAFERARPHPRLAALAFFSGCLALAMEVVWTRMLVQVLHNSVYSFALVLAVMLIALGLGAGCVYTALRRSWATSGRGIMTLSAASGIGVVLSAWVFDAWTDGSAYLGGAAHWGGYLSDVVGLALAVMLVPGVLLGTVFPYLMATAERRNASPGATIGWLVSLNTIGAVSGSLVAGFLLLPSWGLWGTLLAAGCAYVAIPPLLLRDWPAAALAGVAVAGLVWLPVNPLRLARVDVDPRRDVLVSVEDSAEGTVAVVRRDHVVSIKLNNSYTVGTNANIVNDRRKADLPLMLVPDPDSAFFLGMGAGITASAALAHPLHRVTTCELVPAIARAAETHLDLYTRRLFNDPRSRVLFGDGRTVLAASSETFDVIIGDLFVPWHAGTANLYSVEHFRNVRERLGEGGVFAQWLPLYQFTEDELAIVARTMLEVFPLVTLWRGDFQANAPSAALFGHRDAGPIDLAAVLRNVRFRLGDHGARDAVSEALMLLFYVGNVSAASSLFEDSPINTQDWPVLEYRAPVAQRRVKAGEAQWLTGPRLVELARRLEAAVPPASDPYLRNLTSEQQGYATAGLELYESFVRRAAGDAQGASDYFELFRSHAPTEVVEMFENLMGAEPR